MKLLIKVVCRVCDTEFDTTDIRKQACSVKCRQAVSNLKIREQRRISNNKKFNNIKDIPTCKICGWKSMSLQNHLTTHNLTVQQYKDHHNALNEDIFHSSFTKTKSDRITGDKNPGYHHNGIMSSFSINYKQYGDLTDKEKDEAVQTQITKANKTKRDNNNYTTTVEYYTSRGFSIDEAVILRSKRQTTFSLEKCIEKYGEELGIERWVDRQEKWLSSDGMNLLKAGISQISQQLFNDIASYVNFPVVYATNGIPGTNNEYKLRTNNGMVLLDFFAPGLGKIIEFDGDYWHSDKNPRNICRKVRDTKILTKYTNYKILHIWESEYKQDKEGVVNKCLEFLKE